MLSAILKSETAVKVSIQTMNAFVGMRKYINENYHFGASLKDLGKKWFAVSLFDNKFFEPTKKLKKY